MKQSMSLVSLRQKTDKKETLLSSATAAPPSCSGSATARKLSRSSFEGNALNVSAPSGTTSINQTVAIASRPKDGLAPAEGTEPK